MRREKTVFSEEMLQELAEYAESQAQPDGQLLEDLRHCMKKLSPDDRELIRRRYEPGVSAEQIAVDTGRPTQWVYKAVHRIRAGLRTALHDRRFYGSGRRHHERRSQGVVRPDRTGLR